MLNTRINFRTSDIQQLMNIIHTVILSTLATCFRAVCIWSTTAYNLEDLSSVHWAKPIIVGLLNIFYPFCQLVTERVPTLVVYL